MKKSQKVYVNGKSFAEYVKSTFVPHVMKGRVDGGIGEQEAGLLMDNCPSHIAGDVMDFLTASAVRVVTFAPRTTQIFQLLDLTLFGIFKQKGKYYLPFDELTTTTNFMYNVYIKLAKTLTHPNI
jgi:hypothetical protein